MNRRLLVLGVGLALAASAAISTTAGAAAHQKVGPHEYFNGLVNGSIGAGRPAIIKVVCPDLQAGPDIL